MAAGAVWAAYELATLLLFFETIPSEKRVGVLTVFNLANAAAVVLGSALGGAVLAVFSASRGAYLALFAISALARAAALVMLVPVPRAAISTPAAVVAVARTAAAAGSFATACRRSNPAARAALAPRPGAGPGHRPVASRGPVLAAHAGVTGPGRNPGFDYR